MDMGTEDELSKLEEDIKNMKKWIRIQGLESLRRILEEFDDADLVIFDAADGESTTREIGEEANVSRTTVSNRMNEWHQLGIVEKEERKWKHMAPLAAMGIDRPNLEEDKD